MPHTRKKNKYKNQTPEKFTPIEKTHCNVGLVVESILHNINTNWITKEEWLQIVEEVNKQLK